MWDVLNLSFVEQIAPTGSREICDPAPMDTDLDIICLVETLDDMHGIPDHIRLAFEKIGFIHTSGLHNEEYEGCESDIDCYQFGEINLIVIWDKDFYRDFLLATTLCKSLNVLDKEKRIKIFQEILYGNFDEKDYTC